MAKTIRFPLKMRDNYEARTIEELREHFDLKTVLSYYSDGRLTKWLENGYYGDEAKKVAELSPIPEGLGKQICDILGVAYSEDTSVDVGAIFKKTDKLAHLKKFTSDDSIIAAVDRVAFSQDELDALVKSGVSEVYLCGEHFTVFTNNPNVTYVGVNMPDVELEGDTFEKEIHIKDIKFDIDKYLEKYYDLLVDDNQSVENFVDFFISDLKPNINSSEIVSKKAQCIIGICYEFGDDCNEASLWYRKSAEQNFADAQYYLGELYYSGDGVEEDDQEAVKWFRKSAEQGNASAQYSLGNCYEDGVGIEEDKQEAIKWFRLAAEQGDAVAQFALGRCYYESDGVEEDKQKAVKWFRKSAEQGFAVSQSKLGDCYYNGFGVQPDQQEAVKWYRLAAEQGDVDAQFNLGCRYGNGEGVDQDIHEAAKWFRKSAEQGNADAQNQLGCWYMNGIVFGQDSQEAVKWFRMASNQGLAMAMYNLSNCYYFGNGVAEDKEKATSLLCDAAHLGYADAQFRFGLFYFSGLGTVEQEYEVAVHWFYKAAEQGHVEAQSYLGRCLYHGNGIEKDKNVAKKWLRMAAEQGDVFAQTYLERHY